MGVTCAKRVRASGFWLVFLAAAGCAGDPLWLDIVAINPYVRQEWQEDEKYGPSFYTRRDELRDVRESAPTMTPRQQDQLAYQLTELIRQDPNSLLRREAVLTLGFLATPSAVDGLRAGLSDSDEDVRSAACRAWSQRGGPEAPAVLAEVVGSDQNLDVRISAVKELSRFQGPVVQNALAVALEDPDPALQYRAVQSLRQTSDRDYGNNVYAWREYLRGNNPTPPLRPSLVQRMIDWF